MTDEKELAGPNDKESLNPDAVQSEENTTELIEPETNTEKPAEPPLSKSPDMEVEKISEPAADESNQDAAEISSDSSEPVAEENSIEETDAATETDQPIEPSQENTDQPTEAISEPSEPDALKNGEAAEEESNQEVKTSEEETDQVVENIAETTATEAVENTEAAVEETDQELATSTAKTEETTGSIPDSPEPVEKNEAVAETGKQGEEASTETTENKEQVTEEHPEEIEIDYSAYTKAELLKAIADISGSEDGFKRGKDINHIHDRYDIINHEERESALNKFILDGGDKDDFKYRRDDDSTKIEEYFKIIKQKRAREFKDFEKQKEQNLKLKTEFLEKLREFVDNDENTSSINEMKKLQEEWKAIGPVHPQHNKTLWANYNALLDLYYDHRSIYFELKELDRKKNLESKLELCVQAEALDSVENLNEAIKKLNELHDEFKHIGPIPKAQQEEIWTRFKGASDKIYAKRKDFVSHLKESLKENLDKKIVIAGKVQEFTSFTSETISEWNAKTKEILAVQKEWEAIGSMPKEKAKEINKQFWGGFKTFFHHKSEFFKSLDSKREENLKLKQEIVDKAVAVQESEDWDATANILKGLQKDWKNIGPVPEKQREPIYQAFKAACDTFFNRRRDHGKDMQSAYGENLKLKDSICDQLEKLAGTEDLDVEDVYALQDQFNEVGFVPRKNIKSIQNRFQSAINAIIEGADMDHDDMVEFKSMLKINKLKAGPHGDQKLNRKEHALKRKIQNLESDISTWKNNLGFFANSKNASEMMKDFEKKIEDAEQNLADLKEELRLIYEA